MGVIFAGVSLFPRLFGIVLEAPVQQQTRCGGQSDSQSVSPSEEPTEGRTNNQNQLRPDSPHKYY